MRNGTLKLALQKGMTVKVKDLVETEEHLKTVRSNMQGLQNILKAGYQQIQQYVGIQHEVALNFNDFISVSKVENIVNLLKTNKLRNSPELRAFQSKMNLVQTALKLDEADFNSYFDNFQLNYSIKAANAFSPKDFGIRLGINIPIKGNFRPKQNEYLLDMKMAENEYNFAAFEQDRLTKLQMVKVENLLKQYKTVTEQANQGLAKNMLENEAVSMRLSAADIIDLKILQHEKEADLIKINHELVREYIVLLELTGDLVYSPLKNYLSNQLEKY
jgi:outer membrane protein TolC